MLQDLLNLILCLEVARWLRGLDGSPHDAKSLFDAAQFSTTFPSVPPALNSRHRKSEQ